MTTSTWAVTATLAAVGVTLPAAADPFGGALRCTLAGADPGVALQPASRELLDRFAAAEVCVDDTCRTVDLRRGRAFAPLRLPDSGDVELRIALTAVDGRPVPVQQVRARTVPFSPNGAKCGPTIGTVTLSLAADATVRQVARQARP